MYLRHYREVLCNRQLLHGVADYSYMDEKKIKVGVVCICLNPPYWTFANEMLWGLNTFFLKHKDIRDKYETEFMLWSDMPENPQDIQQKVAEYLVSRGDARTSVVSSEAAEIVLNDNKKKEVNDLIGGVMELRKSVKVFPTEPVEWPLPTLLRYNLFLQQEEKLKDFDYLFYIDVDMRITDWIGEEILGEGLTAAQHPMYALKRNLYPPYEPNPESTAFIPRPGRTVEEDGKKRFEPLYYAGGFQGGKTEDFIKAMKVMRKNIERDFNKNYIAVWNDESHWNRYLFDNLPAIVLSPSYIYPDSLIADYYVKQVWGRNYSPKIMTLTKAFTTSSEGGAAVQKLISM